MPYCVFTIIALQADEKYFFQRLYVAYRKSSLTGNRSDMLYLPNMMNVGMGGNVGDRPVGRGHNDERDGFSRSDMDLSVCMGSGYNCAKPSLVELANEALSYFWMVPFNGDLGANFERTTPRDRRVENVATWERNSTDSLSVLDVNWIPSMPLGEFLSILKTRWNNSGQGKASVRGPATRSMNSIIGNIYDEVWREIKSRNLDNGRLATALHSQIDNIMKKFAAKLGVGLSSLPHDTVRRQVQIAVAEALRESMR